MAGFEFKENLTAVPDPDLPNERLQKSFILLVSQSVNLSSLVMWWSLFWLIPDPFSDVTWNH